MYMGKALDYFDRRLSLIESRLADSDKTIRIEARRNLSGLLLDLSNVRHAINDLVERANALSDSYYKANHLMNDSKTSTI